MMVLLAQGSDATAVTTSGGETPFDLAMVHGHGEALLPLLAGPSDGWSALHVAAWQGDLPRVQAVQSKQWPREQAIESKLRQGDVPRVQAVALWAGAAELVRGSSGGGCLAATAHHSQ